MRRRRFPHNEEKELEDANRLYQAWKNWHAEQLQIALAGAHGALIAELMAILDRLELSSSATLLAHMQRSEWDQVDADTRLEILHQIDARISRIKEHAGLPAIDDPLPHQRDNVFRVIKARLFNSRVSGDA